MVHVTGKIDITKLHKLKVAKSDVHLLYIYSWKENQKQKKREFLDQFRKINNITPYVPSLEVNVTIG